MASMLNQISEKKDERKREKARELFHYHRLSPLVFVSSLFICCCVTAIKNAENLVSIETNCRIYRDSQILIYPRVNSPVAHSPAAL